jgi:hypothetical protein
VQPLKYLAAVATVVAAAFCYADEAGAEPSPYRMDASNQAGWWKPIEEWKGSIYLAYDAWGSPTDGDADDTHTVYVARRSPDGTWVRGPLPYTGPNRYRDDIGHRQPSIAIDGAGYIHVFASMHWDSWHYFRSSRPGDPTSMVDRSGSMPAGSITYPNATRAANGDVYVIARDSGCVGRLYRWALETRRWSSLTFASDPNFCVYPDDVIPDPDGSVHIAWEWAYLGTNGLRHLGSHVRYDPVVNIFVNAAGVALRGPASTATASVIYAPEEPGESRFARSSPSNPAGLQSAKLALDPSGRPAVAYRTRPAGGRFAVRFAEWNGIGWVRSVVYAGTYTTYAAVDVTFTSGGAPRVYYAKTATPTGTQAHAATRSFDGTWVERQLLPKVRVERLAVIRRSGVDHVYLSVPSARRLYLELVR